MQIYSFTRQLAHREPSLPFTTMFSRPFTAALTYFVAALTLRSAAKQIMPKVLVDQGYTDACLMVNDDPGNKTEVVVDFCSYAKGKDWDVNDDGTIRMKDFCLDISGANFANGTQLELFQCLGNDAQAWKVDGNLCVSPPMVIIPFVPQPACLQHIRAGWQVLR